jgi:SAM-dependent methyltransferase
MQPELAALAGRHLDSFDRSAVAAAIDDWINHRLGGEPEVLTRSREAYVAHHLARSLAAVSLLPQTPTRGKLLELGSGIYLMTFLAERLRNYDIDMVQYWGRPSGEYASALTDVRSGASRTMPFREFNGEVEAFPYEDGSFDAILNCDTIEHVLCDPVHMLAECHRVLKPGGVMVLTTPNVLRLDNVAKLLQGRNILDKYVLESASARHPREYAPQEISRLLEWVGFDVAGLSTIDVTRSVLPRTARRLATAGTRLFRAAARFVGCEGEDPTQWRGEQIILTARRARPVNRGAPEFLYEAPGAAQHLIDAIYSGTVRS